LGYQEARNNIAHSDTHLTYEELIIDLDGDITSTPDFQSCGNGNIFGRLVYVSIQGLAGMAKRPGA
jgi:hypothetical protein